MREIVNWCGPWDERDQAADRGPLYGPREGTVGAGGHIVWCADYEDWRARMIAEMRCGPYSITGWGWPINRSNA